MRVYSFFRSFFTLDKMAVFRRILNRLRPRQYFFMGVVIVVLVYLKPIFTVWSYSDESDYFSESTTIGRQFAEDGNLFGSFIYNHVSLFLANSVEDFWRLRSLSLICLLVIVYKFSNLVLPYNQSRSIQFIIPMALLLPAPMTFVSFAMIWQGSLGMLMAYFATILWLNYRAGVQVIAVILLSLSITNSPVNAFSIFGFYAAFFIVTRIRTAEYLKTLYSLLVLYGIAGALSVVALLVVRDLFNLEYSQRVGLVEINAIPEKVFWILSRPIAVSMRFFDISSPTTLDALALVSIVSTLLVFGFVLQCKNLNENVLKRVLLFIILVFLSITPIMITWSNQIEFRYIFGPSFAIFLVFSIMLLDLVRHTKRITSYFIPLFMLSIAILGIGTVTNNTERQFLNPYKSKISFISSEISSCLDKEAAINQVIVKSNQIGFPTRRNIGIFSQVTDLDSPWVPIPTVKHVLTMFDLDVSNITLANGTDGKDIKDVCVVNLENYRLILLNNEKQ